jgi:hypothetical protein
VHRYSEERGEYPEEVRFWENIYADRDFYVQALTDKDDTVQAFAVTTRARRFRPKIVSPGFSSHEPGWLRRALRRQGRLTPIFSLRLGKSRFSELGQPDRVAGYLGAHTFGYWEAHWLGNPGNYQTYVFAVNDAGAEGFHSATTLFPLDDAAAWDIQWPDGVRDFEDLPNLHAFRRSAVMNTYAVLGPSMSLDDYPITYGPHVHHVRTIP